MNESEMSRSEMSQSEMDQLARILAEDEELQPMTGFSTRVMRAVKQEARILAPIAFPLSRFLPGFILNIGLLFGAAVWVMLTDPGSPSPVQLLPAEWFTDPQIQAVLWAIATMVGTGILTWTVSKCTTPSRSTYF